MSSFLTRWISPSDEKKRELRDTLRKLQFKRVAIATHLGMHENNFSAWLNSNDNERGRSISDEQYLRLVLVCYHYGWLNDPFYDRGNQNMGRDDFRVHAEPDRHYVVYRPSYLAAGMVFQGRLTIRRDPDRDLIQTEELYRIQEGLKIGKSVTTVSRSFRRTGYLFIRANDSRLMVSSKEADRTEVQIAYLKPRDATESFLAGPFIDWHGPALHCAWMVAEQVAEELPINDVSTIRMKDVAAKDRGLQKYLTRRPKIGNYFAVLRGPLKPGDPDED